MTPVPSTFDESVSRTFQEAWSASICEALKQSSGEDFDSQVVDSGRTTAKSELDGMCARFTASAEILGEIGFFTSNSDALMIAALLTGKVSDDASVDSEGLRTAMAEFFRQLAKAASIALARSAIGNVEIRFRDFERPSWEAAIRFRLALRGTKTPPLEVCVWIDEIVAKSAAAARAAGVLPVSDSESGKEVASQATPVHETDNIGLLLDIELEATLRFGEREMPLREILSLNSASVVELNRRVNEPVELLVRGKVVARGDVVVLDGNYGLRVTEIASPAERMSSLRIG